MYHSSTQKSHWTFASVAEVEAAHSAVASSLAEARGLAAGPEGLLTGAEARLFSRLVADTALKFCKSFKPTMPPSVIWTAFTYFHRFYTRNSPLEYGPRNLIMSCLYLASKVEEFNVSAEEFVRNLRNGTAESNLDILLSHEPLLMRKLSYHLTVHGPFRPLEGQLISLKTWLGSQEEAWDAEELRRPAVAFLEDALLSPASLLYPPSQIGLAAVVGAGEAAGRDLRPYLRQVSLASYPDGEEPLLSRLEQIRSVVRAAKEEASDQAAVKARVTFCAQLIEKQKKAQGDTSSEAPEAVDSDDE